MTHLRETMSTVDATPGLELRRIDTSERVVVARLVRYGEVSVLAGDPAGERFHPGAFARSLRGREAKVPLLVNHRRDRVLGYSRRFDDSETELVGTFSVNGGEVGDQLLVDLEQGYYSGMSVGMLVSHATRGRDGEREVRQAHLVEASIVGIPAYSESRVLALRHAQLLDPILRPRPVVNLDPIPSPWG